MGERRRADPDLANKRLLVITIGQNGQIGTFWFVYDYGISVLRLVVERSISAHGQTSATSARGDR